MSKQNNKPAMGSKKKIYLAGKVSGLDRKQVETKFSEGEIALSELGYAVINPVTLINKDTDYKTALRKCVRLLSDCDEIALLPDWKESFGARSEHFIAKLLNMPEVALTE